MHWLFYHILTGGINQSSRWTGPVKNQSCGWLRDWFIADWLMSWHWMSTVSPTTHQHPHACRHTNICIHTLFCGWAWSLNYIAALCSTDHKITLTLSLCQCCCHYTDLLTFYCALQSVPLRLQKNIQAATENTADQISQIKSNPCWENISQPTKSHLSWPQLHPWKSQSAPTEQQREVVHVCRAWIQIFQCTYSVCGKTGCFCYERKMGNSEEGQVWCVCFLWVYASMAATNDCWNHCKIQYMDNLFVSNSLSSKYSP